MLNAGLFNLKINGRVYMARGNFTYNHGSIKNEAQVASNGEIPGFKTSRMIPFIEGELFDTIDLNIKELQAIKDAEIVLELQNSKIFLLRNAHWASDGNVQTEDGNLAIRFEGTDTEEFVL